MKNIYFITLFLVIIAAAGYLITSQNEEALDEPSAPSAPDVPTSPANPSPEEPITPPKKIDTPPDQDPTDPTTPPQTPSENTGVSVAEFQTQITELAMTGGMMPIEGFEALLLLSAYPGLTEEDFNNVSTLEGLHRFIANELTYTRNNSSGPVTSAEKTISAAGYQTLLENLSLRSEISLRDGENLAAILKLIQTDPTVIQIQNEFPEKIVYGDNMSLDQDALKSDCDARGGTFNTCGSVCPSTADMCTEQCAFTCEFTDAPVF